MKFGHKSKIPCNFMAATAHVIAKISWKPFCGNFEQVRLGVIFLRIFVHGKQPTTVSIVGRVKGYGRIFFKLRGILDKEWVFIDGSYIRAHQHASGARRGEDRAIGRSRGGATTKIHLAVDAHGHPIDFEITGGEVHDSQVASDLIELVGEADYLIADKGYYSEHIREVARNHRMTPIIPRKSNSKKPNIDFDHYLYRLRHLVENAFARLKHFRGIATRFEKLARNYKSMLFLACLFIWCKAK